MAICSCCGQTIRTARKAKAIEVSGPVDTSMLSTDALFAHYKSTAPNLDAAFFLAHAYKNLTPAEQLELSQLATDRVTNRRDHYIRLTRIQDAWRGRKDAVLDAAFARMRSRWMVNSQIKDFRDKRHEMLTTLRSLTISDEQRGYPVSEYTTNRAVTELYNLVRSTVSRARSAYPRVFAHETAEAEAA